jgi:hypothetical protein
MNRNLNLLVGRWRSNFLSLISQTAVVAIIFATMLVLTGGNPSGVTLGLTFGLALIVIVGLEARRHSRFRNKENQDTGKLFRVRMPAWPVRGKKKFYSGLFIGILGGICSSLICTFLYFSLSPQLAFKTVHNQGLVVRYKIDKEYEDELVILANADSGSPVSVEKGQSGTLLNADLFDIVPNRNLPGFDARSYFSAPPPDLNKYSIISNLQYSSLIKSSSDIENVQFSKNKIEILGKSYISIFNVSGLKNESSFIFQLDSAYKTALLQFGLPDFQSSATVGDVLYTVTISADGKTLWSGECKYSPEKQIISVPLDIAGKKTLGVKVESNGENFTRIFFTEAIVLK